MRRGPLAEVTRPTVAHPSGQCHIVLDFAPAKQGTASVVGSGFQAGVPSGPRLSSRREPGSPATGPQTESPVRSLKGRPTRASTAKTMWHYPSGRSRGLQPTEAVTVDCAEGSSAGSRLTRGGRAAADEEPGSGAARQPALAAERMDCATAPVKRHSLPGAAGKQNTENDGLPRRRPARASAFEVGRTPGSPAVTMIKAYYFRPGSTASSELMAPLQVRIPGERARAQTGLGTDSRHSMLASAVLFGTASIHAWAGGALGAGVCQTATDYVDPLYGGLVRPLVKPDGHEHNLYDYRDPWNADRSRMLGVQSDLEQQNWRDRRRPTRRLGRVPAARKICFGRSRGRVAVRMGAG